MKSGQDIFKHLSMFDGIVSELEDAELELTDHKIIIQLLMSVSWEYKLTVKLLQRTSIYL